MSDAPFQRALVIRGGALGDFLLTLPVLHALRTAAPAARLEVLAYPGLAALAKSARVIDEFRSIEYGPLAGFFTRGAVLDPGLRDYFKSFDLIISYLYDPDGIFRENLHATGAARIVSGPHRPAENSHAIDQLARPLGELGLLLTARAAQLSLEAAEGRKAAIALHPGSGSPQKNWPAERWRELAAQLLAAHPGMELAIIGGEADAAALDALRDLAGDGRVTFWENLPLPQLAARLGSAALYVGHDTGISHLAAAAGAPCLLLFGPTDPRVWAPPHEQVRVLCAPAGKLEELTVNAVAGALRPLLSALRLASRNASSDNPAS